MSMIVHNVKQGSPEWLKARAGRITGSRMSDVMARTKTGGESSSRRDYRMEIACERLTGVPAPGPFVSADMRWGTEQEPFARAAYEEEKGCMVDSVGFVTFGDNFGASPDGLIGLYDAKVKAMEACATEDEIRALAQSWDEPVAILPSPEGILEIKCPRTATHLGYLLAGVVPDDYKPQMAWEIASVGAKWADFMSFDPRLPKHLQRFIIRWEPSEAEIQTYLTAGKVFDSEVVKFLADLPKPPEEIPAF